MAEKLAKFKNHSTAVYALPRGGVEIGFEIASRLNSPLDLLIPRKIGHPSNPEYAIAAITEGGQFVGNEMELISIESGWLDGRIKKEQEEASRRRTKYTAGRQRIDPKGKIVILTDDGVATGLTMKAALKELASKGPAKIVVAVPVMPGDLVSDFKIEADEIVAINIPDFYLGAVGAYYEDFRQVEDEEVISFLNEAETFREKQL